MQLARFYIFEVGPRHHDSRQINMLGVEPTEHEAVARAQRILASCSADLIEQGWRVQVEDNHGHILWPSPKES